MKKQRKLKLKIDNKTLLIVISIAFVLSLGFIYWQNFLYKPVVVQGSDITTTANTEELPVGYTRYLTLDNWGVRIKLKDNSYYYRSGDYKTISATEHIYVISTRSLRVACGTEKATIGSIERVKNSANNISKVQKSNVKGTKVLGEYLYIFTKPDSTCSSSPEVIRLQDNATQELIPLLRSLEEIK